MKNYALTVIIKNSEQIDRLEELLPSFNVTIDFSKGNPRTYSFSKPLDEKKISEISIYLARIWADRWKFWDYKEENRKI